MKNKIYLFIIGLIILINPVLADTGVFEFNGGGSYDTTLPTGNSYSIVQYIKSIHINDVDTLTNITYMMMKAPDTNFVTSKTAYTSYYELVSLYIGVDVVGNGYYGFTLIEDTNEVYIYFVFQDLDIDSYSGAQTLKFSPVAQNWFRYSGSYLSLKPTTSMSTSQYLAYFKPDTSTYAAVDKVTTNMYIQWDYHTLNSYEWNIINNNLNFEMGRDSSNKLQVYINNSYETLLNDTSPHDTNISILNNDITNSTWYISVINQHGDSGDVTLNFITNNIPIIYTDKTSYNTTELIELSWENIDGYYTSYGYKDSKPYEMYILYYDYSLNKYVAKYQEFLEFSLSDETLYLDSSLFQPQTNYIAVIVSKDGSYLNPDTWIVSTEFLVIPDNEYLTLSCETPCYTYSGNTIQIYYRVNNNSVLRIYDSNKTLITSWNNLIDEGVKTYKLPTDTQKSYAYPNWLVYLNNTGYATSYNTSMLVYWSKYQVPTPTPTYTPIPINESIDEQITELKDEIQPLKDLIFGFSEIVIDNPDYDNNNIVTSDEFSNWINGLVSFVIVLFIVIMVIGLKDRR